MSEPTSYPNAQLSHRARAILRATGSGRVQVSLSCEPDVFIDGLPFSDQPAGRALVHAGLLRASRPGQIGERVPARLTDQGCSVLHDADLQPQGSVA
ncbi:MAG: hypothetical protein ACRDQW_12820 [Haloechinothrix sp.]